MNVTIEDHQPSPIQDDHQVHTFKDIPLQGIVRVGLCQKLVEDIPESDTLNVALGFTIVIDIEILVGNTGHHQIRAMVQMIVAYLLGEMNYLLKIIHFQIGGVDPNEPTFASDESVQGR